MHENPSYFAFTALLLKTSTDLQIYRSALQTSPRMDPARLDLCEFTGLDGEALPSPLREATCLQGDPGEHLPSHQTKSGDDSNKHPSLGGFAPTFDS